MERRPVNRGEIRRVDGLARDRVILIASSTDVNTGDGFAYVIGVPVEDGLAAPNNLLVIPLEGFPDSYLLLDRISAVPKKRVGDLIGMASDDVMNTVGARLKALLELS